MCEKCHKNDICDVACVNLMRVPKKDLTPEEWKRVISYESCVGDDTGYGN